jgi:hypothetical protein
LGILTFSRKRLNAGFQFALRKIYLLVAPFTDMLFVELIGKDFHFLSAIRAFTGKRF